MGQVDTHDAGQDGPVVEKRAAPTWLPRGWAGSIGATVAHSSSGQPKLSPSQQAHLVALHQAGEHTGDELAELFSVARSTVYRAVSRAAIDTNGSGAVDGAKPLL